jgi:hypothetical protein
MRPVIMGCVITTLFTTLMWVMLTYVQGGAIWHPGPGRAPRDGHLCAIDSGSRGSCPGSRSYIAAQRPRSRRGSADFRGRKLSARLWILGQLPARSIFKFPIGEAQRGKEVIEPWQDIMLSLMPAAGTDFESLVIALSCLLDQTFQAHIAADIAALLIKRQQSQKARHAAVPVAKWMDAKEVKHKPRDCQKGCASP